MGQFVEVAPYEPQPSVVEPDSPTLLFDADSNRFDGIRAHHPTDGNVNWYLITMTAPDGRPVRAWEVRRPPWKLTQGTFFWSGNDLIVMITGYGTGPKPRPQGKDFTRIPGVFNAGRLMEEAGGAGGFAGNAEEETVNVDYVKIAEDTSNKTIEKFMARNGPANTIVENMPLKTMSTLGDLYDPAAREHEKEGYRNLVIRAQNKAFKRMDDDLYLILNKLITGQDPNHPIQNEPFKALIKQLMNEVLDERGTEPTEGGTPNG